MSMPGKKYMPRSGMLVCSEDSTAVSFGNGCSAFLENGSSMCETKPQANSSTPPTMAASTTRIIFAISPCC